MNRCVSTAELVHILHRLLIYMTEARVLLHKAHTAHAWVIPSYCLTSAVESISFKTLSALATVARKNIGTVSIVVT